MGWFPIAIVGAVMLVIFGFVTSLYDSEGGLTQSGGSTEISATGFTAVLAPIAVRPLTSTATLRLSFTWIGDDVAHDGRLGQNTRVTVLTGTGVSETRYPAGTVPATIEVEMAIAGEQSAYPFDDYTGVILVFMDAYEVADDGSITSTADLPLALSATGSVSGWNTAATFSEAADGEHASTLDFTRAFSTQAFAILILVMSVILAGLALTAGVLMKTRRRIVEATLLSWSAALVFALPALRNFMPNAPPIGAAIDIYVFLWVMVAAVSAAARDRGEVPARGPRRAHRRLRHARQRRGVAARCPHPRIHAGDLDQP